MCPREQPSGQWALEPGPERWATWTEDWPGPRRVGETLPADVVSSTCRTPGAHSLEPSSPGALSPPNSAVTKARRPAIKAQGDLRALEVLMLATGQLLGNLFEISVVFLRTFERAEPP